MTAVRRPCEAKSGIESRCAVTRTEVRVRMDGSLVDTVPEDLHVGIRCQAVQSCVAASQCGDMVFLADGPAAEMWLGPDPEVAGVYDLEHALAVAVAFFDPIVTGPGGA
jgi:hypothetical protein